MKLIHSMALAGIASALILVGCNQATSSDSNKGGSTTPTIPTGPLTLPLGFEDGNVTGVTLTTPTVSAVTNGYAPTTAMKAAWDTTGTLSNDNHALHAIKADGSGNPADQGQSAWTAYSHGTHDLAFDYGTSVTDGRVQVSFTSISPVDVSAAANFGLSMDFPQVPASGGIGMAVILNGNDGKTYTMKDTWMWTVSNQVWNTWTIPMTFFMSNDATPVSLDSVKATVKVTGIALQFRLDASQGAAGYTVPALSKTYTAFVDDILFK